MRRISAALLFVLGFVWSLPVTVSAAQLPDVLNSIPADCPFVFGINVQQLRQC